MNVGIEKRLYPRIPVSWPVIFITCKGSIFGETGNISVGGPLILFPYTIENDDEFQIILSPPECHDMLVTCEKSWSSDFYSYAFCHNALGCSFIKISLSDRKTIASMVDEYYLN
jgi:hypothetical protein